jgi:choline/carnitine/betaine transport
MILNNNLEGNMSDSNINKGKAKLRNRIFIPMSILFISVIILGLVAPKAFYEVESAMVSFGFVWFGWLFQLIGPILLGLCIWIGFSKYGKIKLGGKDAKPVLNYWNWFAISLCAGIATGILFWGVGEPITHFMNPPAELMLEPGSEASAMFSMDTTFLHWTFVPYAMYCFCGISIAFATFNMGLPYRISSMLYPIFGKKVKGLVGDVVDNVTLFAMACAVAAVLGTAAIQIGSGLQEVFGIATTKAVWVGITMVIVVTYIISSYTGLSRGIKWLSDKNSKLFILLMLFVFIFGNTEFILSFGVQSLGHFVQNFVTRATYLSPIDGGMWPRWWPIYYWAIWLAYAPLTGMFLAKVSKGRTIKEFVVMNLIVPATFGIIWFTVFGGAAIDLQLKGAGIWESIQQDGIGIAIFAFLRNFPMSTAMSFILVICIYTSVVTLCDSMTTTVSALSTDAANNASVEPPGGVKIFWGVVMASIAIINFLAGSTGEISAIDAVKQLGTLAGFPMLFLILLVIFSTVKMMVKHERYDLANNPETAFIDEEVLEENLS